MTSAIQSGGFQLAKNQATNLVQHSLNMLNNFLNSAENLRLDDSFIVYFKTVSADHVHYKRHRRGPVLLLGCNVSESLPGHLNIDQNLNPFFVDKCLLTHVILGLSRFAEKQNLFFLLLNICSAHKGTKVKGKKNGVIRQRKISEQTLNKAVSELVQQTSKLIQDCQLPSEGPYVVQEVLPIISQQLDVQIHLINSIQSKQASVESFPSKFDATKKQIVLHHIAPHHASYVYDLKATFRYFKKQVCFSCQETFWFNYQHVCKKSETCFSCRRNYRKPNDCLQVDPFFDSCDSQIEECMLDVPAQCDKCNIPIVTSSCLFSHKKICGIGETSKGKVGFFCNGCNQFFGKNKSGFANCMEAKAKHNCQNTPQRCFLCRNFKEDNHQCPIDKTKSTKKWPNLAFVSFGFKTNQSCVECFKAKECFMLANAMTWKEVYAHEMYPKLVCDLHKEHWQAISEPNVAVIYREIERGSFEKKIIAEDGFEVLDEKSPLLAFPYLSNDFKDSPNFKIESSYKKPCKSLILARESIEAQTQKTLLDKLMLEFTSPVYQNYSVLCLHAGDQAYSFILRGLTDLYLRPYIIQNGNKINLIAVDCLDLRFLNASSYLSGTLEDIAEDFAPKENIDYFPNK